MKTYDLFAISIAGCAIDSVRASTRVHPVESSRGSSYNSGDYMFSDTAEDNMTDSATGVEELETVAPGNWWSKVNGDFPGDGNRWEETSSLYNRIVDELREVDHRRGKSSSVSGYSRDGWSLSLDSPRTSSSGVLETDSLGSTYVVGGAISRKPHGNGVYQCKYRTTDVSATARLPIEAQVPGVLSRIRSRLSFSNRRVVPTDEEYPLVIKYEHNCVSMFRDASHPKYVLLNEYVIMRALDGLGIAPKPVTLSSAVTPTLPQWNNDIRIKIDKDYKKGVALEDFCVAHSAHLRALIMERTGSSLHEFRHSYIGQKGPTLDYMIFAVRAGLRVVELLEILHKQGFVHGDVHVGNVAFRKHTGEDLVLPPSSPDLVLIDFGNARFFPAEIGKTNLTPHHLSVSTLHLGESLLSIWQMNGQRTGRRDDLYRAMELTATLLAPSDEFRAYMNMKSEQHVGTRAARKNFVKFFTGQCALVTTQQIVTICDLYVQERRITRQACLNALKHLDNALENVRSLYRPDQRPDYPSIKSLFVDTLRLLTPTNYLYP